MTCIRGINMHHLTVFQVLVEGVSALVDVSPLSHDVVLSAMLLQASSRISGLPYPPSPQSVPSATSPHYRQQAWHHPSYHSRT